MTPGLPDIDQEDLDERGYVVVPQLVSSEELVGFEAAIAELCEVECARKGISPAADPMLSLFQSSREYREVLYPLLRNLRVVRKMAADVGDRLAEAGLFERWGFRVPMVWSYFRADPPQEQTYLLPMHQDYATTHCRKAWRLWLTLRDADRHHGTLKIVPGTHRHGVYAHDCSDPSRPAVPESAYRDLPVDEFELPAGHAVLHSPFLIHGSVCNASDRMKYVLLVQIQDLATVFDPDDASDEVGRGFRAITQARTQS